MKHTFLILSLTLCVINISAQNFEWAIKMQSPLASSAYSITIDNTGNSYVTGNFYETFFYGSGNDDFLTSKGLGDCYVAKYDPQGNPIWALQMGGEEDQYGYSVAVDKDGNVYTTGTFYGMVDFDPSSETRLLDAAGGADAFVCKMDKDGNLLWVKAFAGSQNEEGQAIAVDANGNVYITGFFTGTVDFNPSNLKFNLTSSGENDVFVSKLDASGNFVWAKRMGGIGDDRTTSISLNTTLCLTGSFQDEVDFDPNTNSYNLTAKGSSDAFVLKLNLDGNFVWAKSFGDVNFDQGNSVVQDAQGNVYTTGEFNGNVDFDSSEDSTKLISESVDVFVTKMDTDGNLVWAKNMGGTLGDRGNGIAVDKLGGVYVTGSFYRTFDFDPSVNVFQRTSVGASDIFISKLNQFGGFVWGQAMGSDDIDAGRAIAASATGEVYTTGRFVAKVDFDVSNVVHELDAGDASNVYILKLNKGIVTGEEANQLHPNRISVYPNPVNEVLFCRINDEHIGMPYSLKDYFGREVMQGKMQHSITQFDLIDLKPGLYFLKINETVLKVMKE